ncbi:sulfotransferase [Salinibacter sp.]|uniref:sulfotransferase n=1 Tax=Salinibacter sp. TaxID=2065818 RepID=UPI0021E7CDEE|nr:sulfotransferase [Salinibacter sp.]
MSAQNFIERVRRWIRTRPTALLNNSFVLKALNLYASAAGKWYRRDFDGVDTYCMFVGYPRSGHSLIGALLDAHPHMVVAYELNALKYVQAGFSESALYYLLLRRSKAFARRGARSAGYSYYVPGQHNGEYVPPLRVIGDKKGGASSEILGRSPKALDILQNTVGPPVKFIHVIRHPLDNIATISRKHGMTPKQATDYYFRLCRTVENVKRESRKEKWCDVHLEAFIKRNTANLKKLCLFLGEETPPSYLRECSEIVFDSPNKPRSLIDWPDRLYSRIEREMKRKNHLKYYLDT